jgi:hypothetical protein
MRIQTVIGAGVMALLLFTGTGVGVASAQEPNATHAVIGAGTPASCQSNQAVNDFTAAVVAGGVVSFNCGPTFVEIVVNTSVVDKPVTVNGGGMIGLNGEDNRQIFFVTNGGNLTLNNISLLDGGGAGGNGGAIFIGANGRVTVNGSYLTSNLTESGSDGGAIYTSGFLTVTNSTLGANEARTAGGDGGAIYINGGVTVIRDSYLINNQAQNGGAIRLVGGALTLERTAVRSNIARSHGGGLHIESNAGAIVNATFSNNQADRGGAIYKIGSTPLTNVTIHENRADLGGGIFNQSGLPVLKNTIVAGSMDEAGSGPSLNCDGPTMASGGRNIISDNTCIPNSGASGDLLGTNPQLGVWLGTPTRGYIPGTNSQAVDRGLGCPAVDQRGFPRPMGPACDIGAIERGTVVFLPFIDR